MATQADEGQERRDPSAVPQVQAGKERGAPAPAALGSPSSSRVPQLLQACVPAGTASRCSTQGTILVRGCSSTARESCSG